MFRLRRNRKTFIWQPSQLLWCSRLDVSTATRLTIVCLQMQFLSNYHFEEVCM